MGGQTKRRPTSPPPRCRAGPLPLPPLRCMDWGDSEQAFGDMVNTHEEWTHEVFDAVPEPGRISRGALPAGVGGGGEPASAVSAVQRAAKDSVQVAGAIPKVWYRELGRSFAPPASLAVSDGR